jgi:hypothetical protein
MLQVPLFSQISKPATRAWDGERLGMIMASTSHIKSAFLQNKYIAAALDAHVAENMKGQKSHGFLVNFQYYDLVTSGVFLQDCTRNHSFLFLGL